MVYKPGWWFQPILVVFSACFCLFSFFPDLSSFQPSIIEAHGWARIVYQTLDRRGSTSTSLAYPPTSVGEELTDQNGRSRVCETKGETGENPTRFKSDCGCKECFCCCFLLGKASGKKKMTMSFFSFQMHMRYVSVSFLCVFL